MLAVRALTGTLVHVMTGVFAHGMRRTAILAVGVVLGAQAGAPLSNRVGGTWILRGLALTMVFVGIRLLMTECVSFCAALTASAQLFYSPFGFHF